MSKRGPEGATTERTARRAARPTAIATPAALGRVRSVTRSGGVAERLASVIAVCEADPTGSAVERNRDVAAPLAAKVGGELGFRWQLVELRAALGGPPAEDDWIRERYGELVDRNRTHPERMSQLRAVGDRIRQLERDGILPAAMVVRSRRPPRPRRTTV